jgi:hypothetical protein
MADIRLAIGAAMAAGELPGEAHGVGTPKPVTT